MNLALLGQVLTAVGLTSVLVAEVRGVPWLQWIAKPLASTGFVLAGLGAGAMNSPFGQALLAAFVLSWLGDVLLIPKGAKKAFLAGLIAFLLGHVAFGAAFVIRGVAPLPTLLTLAGLAIPAGLIGRWLMTKAPPNMRTPVVAYIAIITAMVALAVGAHVTAPDARLPLAAVLFYASDLFVARQRFVQPSLWNRLIGLPLYYAAQLIFALTSK